MEDQLALFEIPNKVTDRKSTTFADNLRLPVHRWFRYSAGFSAEWVKQVVRDQYHPDMKVLDPFAGSGTTLIACDEIGIESVGYEKHYFVRKIAETKSLYSLDLEEAERRALRLLNYFGDKTSDFQTQPELLKKCYTEDTLSRLTALKNAYLALRDSSPAWDFVWLLITSILRTTSHVGTAQWQYVLPNKRKASTPSVETAYRQKMREMISDLHLFRRSQVTRKSAILDFDARDRNESYENVFDLLITSPPYPNNYDYADATRLEMVFWGEIKGWSDLQSAVRKDLIRSCSQHASAEKLDLDVLLGQREVHPIAEELADVCRTLEKTRQEHSGKKAYHTMIAAYYWDLARVFNALRPSMKPGSELCFVIGDSAPYGVYAAADEWLGKLALAAGFQAWSFEKTRDRNIKWKNRKHDVPLKEGRLWIKG